MREHFTKIDVGLKREPLSLCQRTGWVYILILTLPL